MKECIIVIPIYKETLNPVEKIALTSLIKVINGAYDICFVAPNGLSLKEYNLIVDAELPVVNFSEKFFASTSTYSQLCISYDFYNKFSDYEYMLIYQLDCYLFKNDIAKWCAKGYDYIGAPIISPNSGWNIMSMLNGKEQYKPKVGNGGLSLRKIDTFKYLTNPNGEFIKYAHISDETIATVEFEDKYFCEDLALEYDFNIPNWAEAATFAVDMNPEIIEERLHIQEQLMGAHAIDKNIRYWKNIIPEMSNQDVIDFCEDKHKEFLKAYYNE